MKKKIIKLSTFVFLVSSLFVVNIFNVLAAEVYFPTFTETGLPDPPGGILFVLGVILGWILTVAGFLSIISFVIAGIIYLTAAGDEDRAKMGKRAMFYSIMGVVICLSGIVILRLVYTLLGGPLGMWFL